MGAGRRCSIGDHRSARTAWWMNGGFKVLLGLDVGKGEHHAVDLDLVGKRVHDGPLPNSEPRFRALFDKLAARGPLLVVVDQPATIGALPVAVARSCGHRVAYLPGPAMRRTADLHPGRAKTDARDAFVIRDAARPHTLRRSTWVTTRWPSWRCWSGSTTTWPARPPGSAPASVACSPASTHRYRLNRALHTIVLTRSRTDPATRAYVTRRLAEGKTLRDIKRCLKRIRTTANPPAPATPPGHLATNASRHLTRHSSVIGTPTLGTHPAPASGPSATIKRARGGGTGPCSSPRCPPGPRGFPRR